MEQLRISEKNKLVNQQKTNDLAIKRAKDTITRLRTQEQSSFNKSQIQNLQTRMEEFQKKNQELNQLLDDLQKGKLDATLKEQLNEARNNIVKKQTQIQKKKDEKDLNKKRDNDILQNYYKKSNGHTDYFLQKEDDKFCRLCDSIPSWIEDKLKEMPSNKGYIWRGLWCFGYLPSNSRYISMMEKIKGGITKIIEIDDNYRTEYTKTGKGPKILVQKLPRNHFT
jgi:hypothetical protein